MIRHDCKQPIFRGPHIPPDNAIVINSINDFVVQDETSIFLEDFKTYIPGADIITDKHFIVGTHVTIFGTGPSPGPIWRYTGTGAMFRGVEFEGFTISYFSLGCENGEYFNMTTTPSVPSGFSINFMGFYAPDDTSRNAVKFGTFHNVGVIAIRNMGLNRVGLGIDDGITISGTTIALIMESMSLVSLSPTFTGLDLGTSTFVGIITGSDARFIGIAPGSVGISGLPDNGNLIPGVQATFNSFSFAGAITPLVGVTELDSQWEFKNCVPVPDSTKAAFAYMTADQVVTIADIGVFVPVAGGNWVGTVENRFTCDVDGILTYVGQLPAEFAIDTGANVSKAGGGTDRVCSRINIDTGAGFLAVPPERNEDCTKNKDPTSINSKDLLVLNPGHRIQMWVANMDTLNAVTVGANAKMRVINGF